MYGAGEYDIGFGLDAFQTLVGVAQAQPQVVIATVAPPAAPEGHQKEDESPDGTPDGDGRTVAEGREHDVAILVDDEHAEPAEHNELAEEHNELAEEHNELPELAELTEHEEDC
jgi:hypothetical protein